MNSEMNVARTRLETAANAKDRTRCRRWLTRMAAAVLLALVGFAALDYWWLLPRGVRYATCGVLAAAASWGMWRWRGLLGSRTSLKEAALDAESVRPETDCIVSTAAEYASGRTPIAQAYEPDLAVALQAVAAQRLATTPIAYGRAVRGPMILFAVAVGAFAGFLIVIPGGRIALKRVVLPWLGAQYTEVEVRPQDIEVRVGGSVEIVGQFSGRPPKDPRLHWRTNGEPLWRTASMNRSGSDAFGYGFTNVIVPMTYRVGGGDALSPEFQVTPYVPPKVEHLSIGLAYPEYTRQKAIVQSAPEIAVLRGSEATLQVNGNVKLSRAFVRLSDTNLAPLELRPTADGRWTGRITIATNSLYRIELFDLKGRRSEDDTPHQIVATPDAPPKVEVLEPGQDIRAAATNRIPIRISVADDYGVSGITVVYHKLNSAEQTVIGRTESSRNGEWLASAELDLTTLGLSRFDVVAYHAEARDNNTLDGPGIGRSPLYFIEITDRESGPEPPPPPQPGEQMNLLVVQKQIIADTVALTSQAPGTNHLELAARQANARELARLCLQSMAGVSVGAVAEMNSAISSMEQAVAPLQRRDCASAIPSEEMALAHLYRVLALMPDLKVLTVKTNPPTMAKETKPQTSVVLREIKKPAPPETSRTDPEIERALHEAVELRQAQAELNSGAQKLAKFPAPGRGEGGAGGSENQASPAPLEPAKSDGAGGGQGEVEGQGKGHGQEKGEGEPSAKKTETEARPPATTTGAPVSQLSSANRRTASTNALAKNLAGPQARTPSDVASGALSSAKSSGTPQAAKPLAQIAGGQDSLGEGTRPGKGRGQGKGKAKGGGPKGKGKGQGTKPGDGSGQSSTAQSGEPTEMTSEPPNPTSGPESPEELAQKQEELSIEAKALGEMLRRLAGKGTRVGHNLARGANQAAEHMAGAAAALRQGNAAGAGRRGSMSTAELDQLVSALERVLGKRPDLTDVASEEAPKEYEDFISQYFRRLSYEK